MRVQGSLQSQGEMGAGSFLWLSACFKTHCAVSNFSALYLSDRDRKFLEAGGYAVKFLDYG